VSEWVRAYFTLFLKQKRDLLQCNAMQMSYLAYIVQQLCWLCLREDAFGFYYELLVLNKLGKDSWCWLRVRSRIIAACKWPTVGRGGVLVHMRSVIWGRRRLATDVDWKLMLVTSLLAAAAAAAAARRWSSLVTSSTVYGFCWLTFSVLQPGLAFVRWDGAVVSLRPIMGDGRQTIFIARSHAKL